LGRKHSIAFVINILIMNIIEILQFDFVQRALITGIFVALLCSLLGVFLILRRMSLIGDGLSHVSFGAVALGLSLGLFPTFIALPIVILASLLINLLNQKTRYYGDALIGIISSSGIAFGIIFASISNGFNADILSYLFGNILTISTQEMLASVFLSGLVLAIIYFFYYHLFALTFNEDYAKIAGVKVTFYNQLIALLTGISVVVSIKVVGTMLFSALLIIPAMASLQISRSFKSTVILSAVIGVISVIIGIFTSVMLNIPTGGTIVIVNLLFFLIAFSARQFFKM